MLFLGFILFFIIRCSYSLTVTALGLKLPGHGSVKVIGATRRAPDFNYSCVFLALVESFSVKK